MEGYEPDTCGINLSTTMFACFRSAKGESFPVMEHILTHLSIIAMYWELSESTTTRTCFGGLRKKVSYDPRRTTTMLSFSIEENCSGLKSF